MSIKAIIVIVKCIRRDEGIELINKLGRGTLFFHTLLLR